MAKPSTHVRISRETHDLLRDRAEREGVSMAALVRRLLEAAAR